MKSVDQSFMSRALALATKGRGSVSPNPLVGAVIVKNRKIIAEGFHGKFGAPHAEVEALAAAKRKGISVRGATLYVTLEPCVGFPQIKKTPACAPSIINARIKRVFVAMKDPNARVAGRGIENLKKAGIEVELDLLHEEAAYLNRGFTKWITQKIPFVTLKLATSLDGKIATKTGQSKWITGDRARGFVHNLRDQFDAIVAGKNTLIADDPLLSGLKTTPHRVIFDSALKTALSARVFRTDGARIFVITTQAAPSKKISALRNRGVVVKLFSKTTRPLGITRALKFLATQGVTSVLVEGGGEVAGSFIDAKAVDEIFWFIAPKIIGGRDARPSVAGSGIAKLSHALALKNMTVTQLGEDFLFHASV